MESSPPTKNDFRCQSTDDETNIKSKAGLTSVFFIYPTTMITRV